MSDVAVTPPKPRRFLREITSIALAPLLIWTVGWAPHWLFIGMMFLITTLALWEFLILGERKGYPLQKTLSLILLWFLLSAFPLESVSVEIVVFAVLLIVPAGYPFSRSDLSEALSACAVSVLSILYIGMLGGALLRLRLDFEPHGAQLVYFLLLVVWLGDAG